MPLPRPVRRTLYRVHFVVACLIGGTLFFVLAAAALVHYVLRRNGERAAFVWIRGWGFVMPRALGWRVEVENLPTLLGTSPAVVVLNHQSNLDTVPWATFYPPGTLAVGKKELEKVPFFGWLWKVTNNILIDRGDPERARASIAAAAERIRRERLSVWMAPEGHRSGDAEMLPFKKGAFHLAIAAQVPVVPVVTSPLSAVLDAGRWMVRPGRVRVRVLNPIPTKGLTEKDVDALLSETRDLMDRTRHDLLASSRERIG